MISKEKAKLRESLKKQRDKTPISEVIQASEIISKTLFGQYWFKWADIIHCYASVEANNEIHTDEIIRQILKSGKKLVMSKMLGDGELQHFLVDNPDDLVVNKYGIAEPADGVEALPSVPGVIIVPMLGADTKGNRIGYGAGYYDRFLNHTTGVKVGLCMDKFIVDSVPTEDHDIRLNAIVTEKRVLSL